MSELIRGKSFIIMPNCIFIRLSLFCVHVLVNSIKVVCEAGSHEPLKSYLLWERQHREKTTAQFSGR